MSINEPVRITQPFLDVLEVLLAADGYESHGWAIMKATTRAGPTVYKILERLTAANWVTTRWEDLDPSANRPRRRLYRLTPHGTRQAAAVLDERRPQPGRKPGWRLAFEGCGDL
jgi:PadR family transcriptional regulator, regulatory protein PadR